MIFDKSDLLREIQGNVWLYACASDELKENKEVVKYVLDVDPYVMEYATNRMKSSKDYALDFLLKEGSLLKILSDEIKDDYQLCRLAVIKNPLALNYVSERLKGDKQIVLSAVSRNGSALIYAAKEMRADKEVVLEALSNNASAIDFVDKSLIDSIDVIKLVAKNGYEGLNKTSYPNIRDVDLVSSIIDVEVSAIKYANIDVLSDKDFLYKNIMKINILNEHLELRVQYSYPYDSALKCIVDGCLDCYSRYKREDDLRDRMRVSSGFNEEEKIKNIFRRKI